jgi:hypothetical protein
VVHFLLLGALIFAGQRLLVPSPVVSSAVAPADAGAAVLTDEEILYRAAVAVGLDRNDPLVRERLRKLGDWVATGDVEDAEKLEQEARRLGLDRTDVVVRRHLVHAMELALSHVPPSEWPGEQALAAYYERRQDRYAEPGRVRFEHVFFARGRDGISAEPAAQEALGTLREGDVADAPALGDPFLLGAELSISEPDLERRLGPQLASAIESAPVGQWYGPVASAYGEHVVRVIERTPAKIPDLASVRSRVVHAMLSEMAAERLARKLAEQRGS